MGMMGGYVMHADKVRRGEAVRCTLGWDGVRRIALWAVDRLTRSGNVTDKEIWQWQQKVDAMETDSADGILYCWSNN